MSAVASVERFSAGRRTFADVAHVLTYHDVELDAVYFTPRIPIAAAKRIVKVICTCLASPATGPATMLVIVYRAEHLAITYPELAGEIVETVRIAYGSCSFSHSRRTFDVWVKEVSWGIAMLKAETTMETEADGSVHLVFRDGETQITQMESAFHEQKWRFFDDVLKKSPVAFLSSDF